MKTQGIYAITHAASGRVYVGSAVNTRRRWSEHRRRLNKGDHHTSRLQNAWVKYGSDAFTFAVLETVSDKTGLIAREQHWIDKLKATGRAGYNTCPIASSMLGYKFSAKARAKMSATRKGTLRPRYEGYVVTAEHRAAISGGSKGRIHSSEQRAKAGAARKACIITPEKQAKINAAVSAANMGNKYAAGKPVSAETRAKLSAAHKGNNNCSGRILSAETRAKIGASKLGKKHSAKSRANMSISRLGNKNSVGRIHSAESNAKRSASMKATLAKRVVVAVRSHSLGLVQEVASAVRRRRERPSQAGQASLSFETPFPALAISDCSDR